MKTKPFDAVRMMREIRDRLMKRYSQDPRLQEKDLESARRQWRKTRRSGKVASYDSGDPE